MSLGKLDCQAEVVVVFSVTGDLALRNVTEIDVRDSIVIVVSFVGILLASKTVWSVWDENHAVLRRLARQVESIAPEVGAVRIRLAIRNFAIS